MSAPSSSVPPPFMRVARCLPLRRARPRPVWLMTRRLAAAFVMFARYGRLGLVFGLAAQLACGQRAADRGLSFAGSAVGREGEILRRQIDAFEAAHPDIPVEIRSVPDAADQ